MGFITLPQDIVQLILEDFVLCDAAHLSRLDAAFCCRKQRASWLTILAEVHQLADTPSVIHLEAFFTWIDSRRAQVRSLAVDPLSITEAVLNQFCRFPVMSRIHKLIFVSSKAPQFIEENSMLIALLLQYLPSLTHIDCTRWCWMSSAHLMGFHPDILNSRIPRNLAHLIKDCGVRCPLESLMLSGCRVNGRDIAALAISSDNLLELECDRLDDADLETMSKHCHRLKVLRMSCDSVALASSLEQLLEVNPNLEFLQLSFLEEYWDELPYIPNPIVDLRMDVVAAACRKLKELSLSFGNSDVPVNTVLEIVSHCSFVETICINSSWVHLNKGQRMQSACSVSFCCDSADQYRDVEIFCRTISLPLWSCNLTSPFIQVGCRLLTILASRFSEDLLQLSCSVHDVDDSSLLQVLGRFVHLHTLCLYNTGSLTGDFAAQLPTVCPKLISLQLRVTTLVDEDIAILLQGFKFTSWKYLSFDDVTALTDVTLLKIAELFPNVPKLGVLNTSINKDTLLHLILSGELKTRDIQCSHSVWLFAELRRAGMVQPPRFSMYNFPCFNE